MAITKDTRDEWGIGPIEFYIDDWDFGILDNLASIGIVILGIGPVYIPLFIPPTEVRAFRRERRWRAWRLQIASWRSRARRQVGELTTNYDNAVRGAGVALSALIADVVLRWRGL